MSRSRPVAGAAFAALLACILAVGQGCGQGDGPGVGPDGLRAGAEVAADVNGALEQCFGSIPAIPKLEGGAAAALFDRMKNVAHDGSGRLVEAPTRRELEEIGDYTVEQMRARNPASSDEAGRARVESIVRRIVAVLPRSSVNAYRFELLASDQVNAFMSTGGRGIVLEPLLRLMPDDRELAFVLAHELAHGELMHGAEKVRAAKVGYRLGSKLDDWMESERAAQVLAGLSGKLLAAVYDQDQEFEADRLAMCLVWRAGYDLDGGPVSMRTLGGTGTPVPTEGVRRVAYDLRASHPPADERIAYLERLAGMIRARHGGD